MEVQRSSTALSPGKMLLLPPRDMGAGGTSAPCSPSSISRSGRSSPSLSSSSSSSSSEAVAAAVSSVMEEIEIEMDTFETQARLASRNHHQGAQVSTGSSGAAVAMSDSTKERAAAIRRTGRNVASSTASTSSCSDMEDGIVPGTPAGRVGGAFCADPLPLPILPSSDINDLDITAGPTSSFPSDGNIEVLGNCKGTNDPASGEPDPLGSVVPPGLRQRHPVMMEELPTDYTSTTSSDEDSLTTSSNKRKKRRRTEPRLYRYTSADTVGLPVDGGTTSSSSSTPTSAYRYYPPPPRRRQETREGGGARGGETDAISILTPHDTQDGRKREDALSPRSGAYSSLPPSSPSSPLPLTPIPAPTAMPPTAAAAADLEVLDLSMPSPMEVIDIDLEDDEEKQEGDQDQDQEDSGPGVSTRAHRRNFTEPRGSRAGFSGSGGVGDAVAVEDGALVRRRSRRHAIVEAEGVNSSSPVAFSSSSTPYPQVNSSSSSGSGSNGGYTSGRVARRQVGTTLGKRAIHGRVDDTGGEHPLPDGINMIDSDKRLPRRLRGLHRHRAVSSDRSRLRAGGESGPGDTTVIASGPVSSATPHRYTNISTSSGSSSRSNNDDVSRSAGQRLATELQREESEGQRRRDAEMARRLQSEEEEQLVMAGWLGDSSGSAERLLGGLALHRSDAETVGAEGWVRSGSSIDILESYDGDGEEDSDAVDLGGLDRVDSVTVDTAMDVNMPSRRTRAGGFADIRAAARGISDGVSSSSSSNDGSSSSSSSSRNSSNSSMGHSGEGIVSSRRRRTRGSAGGGVPPAEGGDGRDVLAVYPGDRGTRRRAGRGRESSRVPASAITGDSTSRTSTTSSSNSRSTTGRSLGARGSTTRGGRSSAFRTAGSAGRGAYGHRGGRRAPSTSNAAARARQRRQQSSDNSGSAGSGSNASNMARFYIAHLMSHFAGAMPGSASLGRVFGRGTGAGGGGAAVAGNAALMERELTPADYQRLLALDEQPSARSNGLSPGEMSMLPRQTGNGTGPVEQCCICMDDMTSKQNITRLPACLHTFHSKCISKWLKGQATCPIDKTAVSVSG